MTLRDEARQRLGIPAGNKVLICLDGGGMKGIFTLQLLKRLEMVAGAPCWEWADMLAGTSTGAIIAGLMLSKHNSEEIEAYYMDLVTSVFTRRNLIANRYIFSPAYTKKKYRASLKKIVGDMTLRQACEAAGLDVMITSKDMAAGEETFFSCFENNGYQGFYQNTLLRGVMETTMSAPTYFKPLERFVDGGTTTFNNPVCASVLEAICYGGKGKYRSDQMTVFSFGTTSALRFIDPNHNQHHKGLEIMFWLNYVMDETNKDASEMQVDLLRSGLIQGLDFRRYQASLDRTMLDKIPDRELPPLTGINAKWLGELTNEQINNIDMADVSKFGLMKAIGESVADFICPPAELGVPANQQRGNWFRKDLLNARGSRDELVTAFGAPNAILSHLGSSAWLDEQPA